ncbi:MAG: hypothetical protein HN383_15390 [Verrucomicrobia bacterium]|nr:hypothetical protein [Verrucomicrobiota bacterium]MBT7702445.1 hypothetical protein [Verrucomicrobiota bacterium]
MTIAEDLGRDDLFAMVGNDLTVTNENDWVSGSTNYVKLTTTGGADLIVAVTMGGATGTLFIFR